MNAEYVVTTLGLSHQIISAKFKKYLSLCSSIDHYRFHIYQTLQYVKHTSPILQLALSSCPTHLLPWLEQHIDEEKGHDQLFESDLIATGGMPAWPVSPFTTEFVHSAYASVVRDDGFSSLLADMLLAEGCPPSNGAVCAWAKSLGIYKSKVSGLLVHADSDTEHSDQILKKLCDDAVNLDLVQNRLVSIAILFSDHMDWLIETSHLLNLKQNPSQP